MMNEKKLRTRILKAISGYHIEMPFMPMKITTREKVLSLLIGDKNDDKTLMLVIKALYNESGRISKVMLNNGRTTFFGYNPEGEIDFVISPEKISFHLTDRGFTISDPEKISSWTFDNDTMSYTASLLSESDTSFFVRDNTIDKIVRNLIVKSYHFDDNDNIIKIEDHKEGFITNIRYDVNNTFISMSDAKDETEIIITGSVTYDFEGDPDGGNAVTDEGEYGDLVYVYE